MSLYCVKEAVWLYYVCEVMILYFVRKTVMVLQSRVCSTLKIRQQSGCCEQTLAFTMRRKQCYFLCMWSHVTVIAAQTAMWRAYCQNAGFFSKHNLYCSQAVKQWLSNVGSLRLIAEIIERVCNSCCLWIFCISYYCAGSLPEVICV